MISALKKFLREECGQDIIEYVLLLGFIVLASAALFTNAGQSVQGVWTNANQQLSFANAQFTPKRH